MSRSKSYPGEAAEAPAPGEDARESMGRIKEARDEVALKLFRFDQSREETRQLKQEYEAAVSDLLRTIDEENTVLPLFEGAPKVPGTPIDGTNPED